MTDLSIMETGVVRGAGRGRHAARSIIHERDTLQLHYLPTGGYLMAHPANRRRFLQAAVGSSVGAWVATGVSGQAEAPMDAGSSAILDAGGIARKFWIDPSIAAWRSEEHTSE